MLFLEPVPLPLGLPAAAQEGERPPAAHQRCHLKGSPEEGINDRRLDFTCLN